jgi:hydroxymethylpyrimidine/phosphomethylpyrimidine kinase
MNNHAYQCCLTIAGSDSGGNAGIQADLRTFHQYFVHGCTVFTAMTAQNPHGVSAILALPPEFIAQQLDAVLGLYAIKAAKTGMLPNADAVHAVASRLRQHPEIPLIIDPVMVATSGAELCGGNAQCAMCEELFPLASLITPNLAEAEKLLSAKIPPDGFADAAIALHRRYHCPVLLKGGHGTGNAAVDVLCTHDSVESFSLPRIENPVSTHGTGCTLSAAIAAGIARGESLSSAVAIAKRFVHDAIAASRLCGNDIGVLGFTPPCFQIT